MSCHVMSLSCLIRIASFFGITWRGRAEEAFAINKDECQCFSALLYSQILPLSNMDGNAQKEEHLLECNPPSRGKQKAEGRIVIKAERIAPSRGSWAGYGGEGGDTALFGSFKSKAPAAIAFPPCDSFRRHPLLSDWPFPDISLTPTHSNLSNDPSYHQHKYPYYTCTASSITFTVIIYLGCRLYMYSALTHPLPSSIPAVLYCLSLDLQNAVLLHNSAAM